MKRILLFVNKNPEMNKLIKKHFSLEFEIITAKSAEEGLNAFLKNRSYVEAAITDYQLPDMNAMDLTRKIRKISNLPAIFLLTTHADKEKIRQKAIEAGVESPILAKPFDTCSLKIILFNALKERIDKFSEEVFSKTQEPICELESYHVLKDAQGEAFIIRLQGKGIKKTQTIISSCFFSTEVNENDPNSHLPDISSCMASARGCNLSCKFCLSGKLAPGRISNQELFEQAKIHLTKGIIGRRIWLTGLPWECSFMGPGEALHEDSYEEVITSIKKLHEAFQKSSTPRKVKFTISTAGIRTGLEKLLKEDLPKNLILRIQISVHGSQIWRETNMPVVAKKYPLDTLYPIIPQLAEKLGHKVWLNFAFWKGPKKIKNCSPEDMENVAKMTEKIGKEHIIIFATKGNKTNYFEGVPATNEDAQKALDILQKHGIDARPFSQLGWFRCGKVGENLPDFSRR